MKLIIALLSPDDGLVQFFGRQKDRLIPPGAAARGIYKSGVQLSILSFLHKDNVPPRFEQAILEYRNEVNGCLMLIDDRVQALPSGCEHSLFLCRFSAAAIGSSPLNFFKALIARLLRSFGQLYGKGSPHLMLLPLRNFHAQELTDLSQLIALNALDPDFGTDLHTTVAQLSNRVRPRRRSTYKTEYAVDDCGRFFKYGLEKHSRFETAPPHKLSCVLAGHFRFGIRVDPDRHYNVSEGEADRTSIEGNFRNCHDDWIDVPITTHLNMFCNDYF